MFICKELKIFKKKNNLILFCISGFIGGYTFGCFFDDVIGVLMAFFGLTIGIIAHNNSNSNNKKRPEILINTKEYFKNNNDTLA